VVIIFSLTSAIIIRAGGQPPLDLALGFVGVYRHLAQIGCDFAVGLLHAGNGDRLHEMPEEAVLRLVRGEIVRAEAASR
jgi:hypothetical protein